MSASLPRAGGVLGAYSLRREVGEGGVAAVFIAEHAVRKRQVALKLLRPEVASDPAGVALFLAEPRAYQAVKNEHVLQVLDVVSRNQQHYFATELCRGQTLASALRAGRMQLSRALHIARQVAEAIAAVHDADLVHRNIKPTNVFLTTQGADADFVKLTDLAVVRSQNDDGKTHVAGMVVGSPAYMAPEQLKQQPGDHRIDVYSFGVLLFELCVGRRPFVGEVGDVVRAQILDRAPRASSSMPGGTLPDALDMLIAQCLEKRPEDRPASMHEPALALAAIAESIEMTRADAAAEIDEVYAVPKNTSGFTTEPVREGAQRQARPPVTAETSLPITRPPSVAVPARKREPEEATELWTPPTRPTPAHTELDSPTEAVDTLPPRPPPPPRGVEATGEWSGRASDAESLFDDDPGDNDHPDSGPHDEDPGDHTQSGTQPAMPIADSTAIAPVYGAEPPSARSRPWLVPALSAFGAVAVAVVGILLFGGDGDAAPRDVVAAADASAPAASVPDAHVEPAVVAGAAAVQGGDTQLAGADPTPAANPTPTAPPDPDPPVADPPKPAPPGVAPPAKPSKPAPVSVSFTSTPSGARVVLRSGRRTSELCSTPCVAELPPGDADVELKLSGYTTARRSIDVTPGASVDATLSKRERRATSTVAKEGDLLNPF